MISQKDTEDFYDTLEDACLLDGMPYIRWNRAHKYPLDKTPKVKRNFCVDLGVTTHEDLNVRTHEEIFTARNVILFSITAPLNPCPITPTVRTILEKDNFSPNQHRYTRGREFIPKIGVSEHIMCVPEKDFLYTGTSEMHQPTRQELVDYIRTVSLQLTTINYNESFSNYQVTCKTCNRELPRHIHRTTGFLEYQHPRVRNQLHEVILKHKHTEQTVFNIMCPYCFMEGKQLSLYGYGVLKDFSNEHVVPFDPEDLGGITVISSSIDGSKPVQTGVALRVSQDCYDPEAGW